MTTKLLQDNNLLKSSKSLSAVRNNPNKIFAELIPTRVIHINYTVKCSGFS